MCDPQCITPEPAVPAPAEAPFGTPSPADLADPFDGDFVLGGALLGDDAVL